MAVEVKREEVWGAEMEDRPGALAGKLQVLADAGAQLEFVLARRAPEKPGTGLVFVAPVRGAAQRNAAQRAGFARPADLHAIRVAGPDRTGMGAKLTQALATKGINLRGLFAATIGRRFVAYFAMDTAQDAAKAARIIKQIR